MSRFPSLPERPTLADVFRRFPEGVMELCEFHDIVLRGPSPLTVAERELIAAYVSGLNACNYCHGAHRIMAEVHGMEPALFERLVADPAGAGVEARLLPLLAYARKLTNAPARMTDADAQAAYAAGWDEQALFHTVLVCALFNFMNRVVEGCGVVTDTSVQAEQRQRHESLKGRADTYRQFAEQLGLRRDSAGTVK